MLLPKPAPIDRRPLLLVERALPEPGPRELLVRVSACGVCHTDLHIVEGELAPARLPTVPGHEIVGRVEAVGSEVSLHRRGDRIGVPWLGGSCGGCAYCRSGRENLCPEIRYTGVHRDGGFQEATLVDERFAFPLPASYDAIEAAPLLCAGVVGYRSLRMSRVEAGSRLGLYGFGASAHIVLQIARYLGCRIFVFTRSEEHRRLARELGAEWAGNADEEPGLSLDASIIFAPSGALVPLALARLVPGGSLVLGGIHMSPLPGMPYDLLWHERTIQSVANSTRQDVIDLLEIAPRVPVRCRVERYPLERANEVLGLLKQGRVNGAAVLETAQAGA